MNNDYNNNNNYNNYMYYILFIIHTRARVYRARARARARRGDAEAKSVLQTHIPRAKVYTIWCYRYTRISSVTLMISWGGCTYVGYSCSKFKQYVVKKLVTNHRKCAIINTKARY